MINDQIINKSDLVLITGANGFIGSKVLKILLEYGFKNIRCLVRSNKNLDNLKQIADSSSAEVQIYNGNLISVDDCKAASKGVSLVYHLAAGTGKSFPACLLNSVVTTRNLLDSVVNQTALKRFVNISSIAVYSNQHIRRSGLMDETCEVDQKLIERFEPYTYGKMKQDRLVVDYAKNHGLPYVIVRPSVVFGPGKAKITGRIGLDTFGVFLHLGLNNAIPLTYVDNCAEAIVLAGLRQGIEGHVFNITDDNLPKSKDILRMYKERVRQFFTIPVPYPIWYLFNYFWEKYSYWSEGQLPPVFNRRSCAAFWKGNTYSNEKAKEILGWTPRVPMNEALDKFFEYMHEVRIKND